MMSARPPPALVNTRVAELRQLLECHAARAVQLLELAGWAVDAAGMLRTGDPTGLGRLRRDRGPGVRPRSVSYSGRRAAMGGG